LRPTIISRRYPSAISPSGQEAAIRRFHSPPGFDTLFGELDPRIIRKIPMNDFSEETLVAFLEDSREHTETEAVLKKGEAILKLLSNRLSLPSMAHMHLSSVDLCGVDMAYVDLCGANLEDALLIGTVFSQADLMEANLTRANLGGATFFDADVSKACFHEANLAKVDFTEVNAEGAQFTGADIGHASILMDANFAGADLSKAILQGAKLKSANLTGANLTGADLRGAENLSCDQLRSAIIDTTTKLPAYMKINWINDREYDCHINED
jgi:uncharacterized protein YjbI with pentapeptide repeats